jgi:hypothetical protein
MRSWACTHCLILGLVRAANSKLLSLELALSPEASFAHEIISILSRSLDTLSMHSVAMFATPLLANRL